MIWYIVVLQGTYTVLYIQRAMCRRLRIPQPRSLDITHRLFKVKFNVPVSHNSSPMIANKVRGTFYGRNIASLHLFKYQIIVLFIV